MSLAFLHAETHLEKKRKKKSPKLTCSATAFSDSNSGCFSCKSVMLFSHVHAKFVIENEKQHTMVPPLKPLPLFSPCFFVFVFDVDFVGLFFVHVISFFPFCVCKTELYRTVMTNFF